MIEYEATIRAADKPKPKILAPRMTEALEVKEGRTPDETRDKLLTELRLRLTQVSPDVAPPQMVGSIQDTLELSDEELRTIIPEGSGEDHITDSFVSIWYMASAYPEETFAQDMREKHSHSSYRTTEPASHLELMQKEGVGSVLMEHYRIFKGTQFPTPESAPLPPTK